MDLMPERRWRAMPYLLTADMAIAGECCREACVQELKLESEPKPPMPDEKAFLLTITGDEFLSHGEFLLK